LLKNNKILLAFYLGIAAFFMIGIVKLFVLRFEAGDVYPAYSSLRSDPLGTKAFYESLENLEPVTVRRNYRPLPKLQAGKGATLFFLGADTRNLTFVHEKTLNAMTRFVASGGRLVISLMSETRCPDIEPPTSCAEKETKKTGSHKANEDTNGSNEDESTETTSKDPPEEQTEEEDEDTSGMCGKFVSLMDYWGVEFGYDHETRDVKYAEKTSNSRAQVLPDTVSFHTALYFSKLHDAWNKIYTCNDHPVIIERHFGMGTVVFSADTFLLSNEALLMERHPELLTWFMGDSFAIIFDESHFGIRKRTGVAGLARKYHLHWFFFGLIVVVGLFVWKNSVYFVPPVDRDDSTTGNDLSSEKDYTDGLISLLRRNISKRDILRVCVEEWKRSFSLDRDLLKNKLPRIQAVIDAESQATSKQGDPVRGYKTICQILSERNN